jgi:hypothetical protein
MFAGSTIYMPGAEYDAVFGPEPQKYNFIPANFKKLPEAYQPLTATEPSDASGTVSCVLSIDSVAL